MSLLRENVLSAVLDDIVVVVRAVRVGGWWVMLSVLFVRGVWVKHRCDSGPFLDFSQTEASSGKVQRPRWNNIKPYTRKAFQSLLQGLGAFDIPESREESSFDSDSYLQSKFSKELTDLLISFSRMIFREGRRALP